MRHVGNPLDIFVLSDDTTGAIYWDGFGDFSSQGLLWFLPPSGDVPAQMPSSGGSQVAGATTLPYQNFTGTGPTSGYEWGGISFSSVEGYYYPPDNGMAANAAATGSQTVVSAENDAVMITAFSSGSPSSGTESLTGFLGNPSSGGFYSDQRVLFSGGAFIVTTDDINPGSATSYVKYAVSTTSAPETGFSGGDWNVSQVSTTINGTWSDQPLAAANDGYLYITTNQFSSSGSYKFDYLTAVSISSPTTGSQTPAASFALNGPSYQPASISHSNGSSSVQYFVAHNGGSLNYFGMNGTTVVPGGSIAGMPGNGSFSASQAGTSYRLDAGDGRVTSAAYDAANNVLYAVFEMRSKPSKPPSVELVQFTPGSTTAHVVYLNNLISNLSGLPAGSSTSGAATFNGSVSVDNAGDVLANFNVSGPSMFPADVYAVWTAGSSGPPSLTSTPSVFDYNNSVAAYIDPAHDAVGRWGDYSTATADASSTKGLWISNEYDNGSVALNGSTYSSWGTVLTHVTV